MKILFIAYFYPPLGGPAVQRPLKTIKYLKQAGFYVDVLTVGDIQYHSYDPALLEESTADHIFKASSFHILSIFSKLGLKKSVGKAVYFGTPEGIKRLIRGLFIIDDKIGWLYPAYKCGLRLIKKNAYDCIIATVGPLTSGMVALKLHKKTKLPFYVDYRDPMTQHPYSIYLTRLQKNISARYEKRMLTAARGVFIVTSKQRDSMIAHFGAFLSRKSYVVYNGYDEPDFNGITPKIDPERKYIRFFGTLYGYTDITFFITALKELVQANEVPQDICIEFIGNYYTETQELLKSEALKPFVHIHPQCSHKEAIEMMLSAGLLLLFISTMEGDVRIPGKVFEYIRSGRPIFAMVPEQSEVAAILRGLGHKWICALEDVNRIKECLCNFWSASDNPPVTGDVTYTRENQTNRIISILKKDYEED